jgi:amino acid adenylation domain-containing protein
VDLEEPVNRVSVMRDAIGTSRVDPSQDMTFYQRFETSARRYPDRVALEVADQRITYAELRTMALALAEGIIERYGGRPGRIALVTASRTVPAYAGYLAIQRVGASVVPLNPEYPEQRNLDVAQRAGVEVALTDPAAAGLFSALPERFRPAVLVLETDRSAREPADGALPPVPADLEREAFMLFTSGSTGQPKGVPITQRNFSAYLSYNIPRYEVGPGSRLSQVFGLTFDAHAFDLFATWGGGGTLVVPSATDLFHPVDFIVERELTHWFSVPSVIRVAQQFGNLPLGRATSLRHSIFGAEPVTMKHATLWRQVAPESDIHNVYGPTELSLTCTEHRLTGDSAGWVAGANGTVPIGIMYPHLQGVLLDENGRPASDGELCVRGPQRFDGYLDPRENIGRFVSLHGDGPAIRYDGGEPLTDAHWYRTGDRIRWESHHMVHCGRLDHQVKIMGHRVEIGEVEAAMNRNPHVIECAVVAVPVDGNTQLAAAYTGTELPREEIDLWLREHLPTHMVPARIQYLDRIPLNENQKIDRRRLTELFGAQDER